MSQGSSGNVPSLVHHLLAVATHINASAHAHVAVRMKCLLDCPAQWRGLHADEASDDLAGLWLLLS